MKEGDVVIVPMPQADGMVKNRPAIILREMPPFRDLLVSGVSTQFFLRAVPCVSWIILSPHARITFER